MDNRNFGKQLLFFRLQSIDSKTGKPVTQQRLGEMLGHELGRSAYTGAAVSDWERGKSRVNADDRFFLVSLVKILKQSGGIKTPGEANQLLEAGNFRPLNQQEMEKLFPGETAENDPPTPAQNPTNAQFLFENMNFPPAADFRHMLEEAKQGPTPFWLRIMVSLIRRFTDHLTAQDFLKAILWAWIIWLARMFFTSPSLEWDFDSRQSAVTVLVLYAGGSIILPAVIAGMTNTAENPYWVKQSRQKSVMLRLFVHQGAYVGYHTAYFLVLPITPVQVMLGLESPAWLALLKTVFPLVVSYAGAQLIPYNFWLAYKRLDLQDGGVLFVFVLLGPLWALFFIEFYEPLASPFLGGILMLLAITVLTLANAMKRKLHPHAGRK